MKYLIVSLFLLGLTVCSAQEAGDTIVVQSFNYNSTVRDTVIEFPTDPGISYEKILLKYSMRCKDGLVSTGTNVNLGCGEWDYSCNTYLVDSSKIEEQANTIPSHFITNFNESIFSYKQTPVYNYLRGSQVETEIISTESEDEISIGVGDVTSESILSTDKVAGKTHLLYTAEELALGGLSAGNIDGLSLRVLDDAGEARYLKIKLKQTAKTELDGIIDFDGFSEVYYQNTLLTANEVNRFQFHTPFEWDGTSNILIEYNFSNIGETVSGTVLEAEELTTNMVLHSNNEQEIMLTNNSYVECDDYLGIGGSQNRTLEAWIKTTDGTNGEIISWGTNITGRKWVFRLADGLLRLEVHGGGTVSSTAVDDGEWHHVACVLNGSTLADVSFYIDGVLDVNSATGTTEINTSNDGNTPKVRISRGVNNRYLDGVIDDVRIWDTNLSEETINQWKSLKINEDHPNYSSLQLNYEFDEINDQIEDSSDKNVSGTLIGNDFRVSTLDGASLFKDFFISKLRPTISFYQGEYTLETTLEVVDKPIQKEPFHFVISRSILPGDPTVAKDDEIAESSPTQYWTAEEKIFDELTGDLIIENMLDPDGEIQIIDLDYLRRFPFYNELVSFVTPYGIGLDLGMEGKSWYMDMSDYVTILQGEKRMLMTLGGQWQEDMDLEFLFIVGTPPRDVLQYDQIWQGTNRIGNASISQILNDSKFAPKVVNLSAEATTFKLKSSITGHGSHGEFSQNGGQIDHRISIDNFPTYEWTVTEDCTENPIFPQGGTWVYNRQGWCPGQRTLMVEHDLTPSVYIGEPMTIDYTTSAANVATGDYRYHVAHQVVSYGDANFQLDAAAMRIIAPNKLAEYTRVGTICANPIVVIRNTGEQELTDLTIRYWLNDSQSPQEYTWTGSLDFMDEEEVTIPSSAELWFDVQGENNKFYVEISNPNQSTDEYEYNNLISSDIEIPQILPADMIVEFRTNNAPFENSYQLIDNDGNIVGENNLNAGNQITTDLYNLEDKCYKLIVIDTGGDGVEWWANPTQGSGYVRLADADGETLKVFEPDFGGGFEYSFTTDFVIAAEDLNFLTSIKVFPNPARDHVEITADGMSEATIYLTNLIGERVAFSEISRTADTLQLDISNLTTGVYFIVFEKNAITTTRKIVVH